MNLGEDIKARPFMTALAQSELGLQVLVWNGSVFQVIFYADEAQAKRVALSQKMTYYSNSELQLGY